MELEFINYEYNKNKISFKIESNKIIGITGTNPNEIIDIIKLKNKHKGIIRIDNNEITKKNINIYKSKISCIEDFDINLFFKNIYEMMEYIMNNNYMYPKNPDKRIKDAIKIVGLNKDILEKNINECSTSEKRILKIAFSLLLNPNIIIITKPFKGIDLIKQKKIIRVLKKISEKYNKTIIFISDNNDVLYKYTDEMIIFKDDKLLITGKTKNVYKEVDLLIKNNIKLPNIVDFTYRVKQKKVKIEYHQDIRDLIKDIYKHV